MKKKTARRKAQDKLVEAFLDAIRRLEPDEIEVLSSLECLLASVLDVSPYLEGELIFFRTTPLGRVSARVKRSSLDLH